MTIKAAERGNNGELSGKQKQQGYGGGKRSATFWKEK